MTRQTLCAVASLLLLFAPGFADGQGLDSTLARINSAKHAGDHARVAQLLAREYALTGFDPRSLASATLAASEAGDSSLAFKLFRLTVDERYLDSAFLRHVEQDSALAGLRSNPAWAGIDGEARHRTSTIDRALRAELLDLAVRDQKDRERFGQILTRFGTSSRQGDSASRARQRADAALLARLREIVARRGWPGRTMVGDDGAHAAWLIVQHAPADVQRELLPTIRTEISRGEGRLGDLALLEDRVLVADRKPQLYGSQASLSSTGGSPTLDPLVDEPCVDLRRSAMGLEPLADYLKRLGVKYTVSAGMCASTSWSSRMPVGSAKGVVYGVGISAPTDSVRQIKAVVLRPGESVRLSGSVDADMSVVSRGMSWRSTNPLVAVVDSSGSVTALSSGTATIVATANADPSAMGARLVIVSR